MPLPLHMIYIIIKTGFLGFGRKSLVSAESATKLHLAYISDPKQVCPVLITSFSNSENCFSGSQTYLLSNLFLEPVFSGYRTCFSNLFFLVCCVMCASVMSAAVGGPVGKWECGWRVGGNTVLQSSDVARQQTGQYNLETFVGANLCKILHCCNLPRTFFHKFYVQNWQHIIYTILT